MTQTTNFVMWGALVLAAGGIPLVQAQEPPRNVGVIVPSHEDLQTPKGPAKTAALHVIYDVDRRNKGRGAYASEDCKVTSVDRKGNSHTAKPDKRCVVLTTDAVTNAIKVRLRELEEAEKSDRKKTIDLFTELSERVHQLEADLKSAQADLARIRARQAAVVEPEPEPKTVPTP